MALVQPELTFLQSGQAPRLGVLESGQVTGNIPQPGFLGGGGVPTDTSIPSLPTALALVPPGAVPVSVFPPFAR